MVPHCIKILGDSARGDNTLLRDEIDNLQTQTELKLTQIQNGCYTFENEVTQLRQEVINLKDINLNQQELTNELGTLNETLKEQIDDLTDKNETIQTEMDEKTRLYGQAQDRLDECREENYHLSQSLEGAHEDITESELVHDKLNQKLRILGLTHIAWRARNLRQAQILNVEFNTARTAWRNQRDRNRHIARELQNCRSHGRNLQNDKVLIEFWRDRIILRYEKWKNKTHGARQIINNLNQQIFALQNNPLANPINMAGIQDVMTSMAPLLAQITQYIGQEPPDDYINKVIQVFSYGTGLGVGAFDDAVKANILKSKMSGKYAPVPAQHPVGTNIDTPARFRAWLRYRYHELTLGTRQASLTKLTQEKFLPTDIPETYEERIRLLLLQTPNDNDDALAILWNHLPDELFSRMENAAPADIDAFFTDLKNIWLKRQPSTFTYNGNRNLSVITTNSSPIPYQLQPQEIKNRSFDHLDSIAERLGYSDNASRNPDALANFIEDELYSRLGHANYNLRKEPFGQVREDNTRVITRASTSGAKKVYATNKPAKKPQKPTKVTYKCSNCGKIGHRKNKCPKLGKKPKKVNYTYQSEPENSDDEEVVILEDDDVENEEEEEEESISDNESQSCFNEVFLESLKYMISELVPHCPKEILIEARDQSPNPSSHKETNHDYELISQPEKLDNSITLNHAIKVYQGAQIRQNWPNPFEIDFLDIKEPNDVVTISCRIGDLIIPHAILDTGADDSLFTDNIPGYLGIKIDTKNVHKLTGAVGDSQSIGTSYNIPISIDSGNDSITVYEKEISVIPTKKDRNGNDISIMILGTKWQHRVGWDPIVKGEFIATHNGKTITIPLSTRKESRNAFNTEKLQASEVKKNA
ncbi:hypothetical protein Glove_11g85 [Diversispora epigaea]|uniref:CCHC-type domain-containing protein n=1 Tax=Diversispora epigaea TaxID=1348612 RepID=A0A397JXZ2_9GLOM|nr:hypothetical protein Glove_11g85 [Diversispora epigaea]